MRAHRSKPDDDDRTELTRLLRERTLEVSRQAIPLAQRKIGGLGEAVEYVGLADTAERMHAAYPSVVEFLDAVDRINSLIADKLAPIQERLDAAGAAGPEEIAELLQTSATDPLSLTHAGCRRAHHRHRGTAWNSDRRNSPNSLQYSRIGPTPSRPLPSALTSCATRAHVRRSCTRTPCKSCWRARSRSATTPNPACAPSCGPSPHRIRRHFGRFGAGSMLRCGQRVRKKQLAQGLLDRRSELKGRLTAYQAKAARLGLGEDRDLLACNRIATGLLSRKPCDLRAVTRAISDYQQMIVDKREKTE